MDQRLRKSDRILKRADFVRVQRRGKRFRTARMIILAKRAPHGTTRIGITTSTKVGNAPERVHVRRRIREIFRLDKGRWPDDLEFVVIARRDAVGASYEQLQADLYEWAEWWKGLQSKTKTEAPS